MTILDQHLERTVPMREIGPEMEHEQRGPGWRLLLGILGALASVATIAGVLLTVIATHPLGLFAPAVTATPIPLRYSAARPGEGCDSGPGQWANQLGSVNTHVFGTAACGPTGLLITNLGDYSNEAAEVRFAWPAHPFPTTYTVEVDVGRQTEQACAGLLTHVQGGEQLGQYAYLVCPDGTWSVVRADATTGAFTTLREGRVPQQVQYHLRVSVVGDSHTLTINGSDPAIVTDSAYRGTSFVGLVVLGYPSDHDESALFTNFAYQATR
jgi:hypothetical protein